MIFRKMFDSVSSTYTCVMASRVGGEALIIDPVFEKTDQYLTLLEQLELKLVKVIDTHLQARLNAGLHKQEQPQELVKLVL